MYPRCYWPASTMHGFTCLSMDQHANMKALSSDSVLDSLQLRKQDYGLNL